MGVRLSRFQNYFQQVHPLVVTGQIGDQLASNFRMIIDDVRQVNDNQMVLVSRSGEICLLEQEIYRISSVADDQSISLLMDGGRELRFTPISSTGVQPVG